MKYCPRCGNACDDNDVLCSRCGYILGTQPAPYSPTGYYGGAPRRNGTATASLVLGILSIPLMIGRIGFVLAAAAILIGIRALWEIRRSGGAQRGTGLAVAGIVTGAIPLVLLAIVLILLLTHSGVYVSNGNPLGGSFTMPGGNSGIPT